MSLAVLCSGQGGQHAGMFDLIEREGYAGPLVARANECARFDVVAAVAPSATASMFDNAIAQPLVCAYVGVLWSMLESRLAVAGARPAFVAGYSIGELAAYGCVGALSWADVIALSRLRAAVMSDVGADTGLLAIRGVTRISLDTALASNGAFLAIANGDDRWVAGGTSAALDALATDLAGCGATAQRLPVGVAAHTPLLSDAVGRFRADLGRRAWKAFHAPVIAGIDATAVRDASTAIDRLARQIATPIRWSDCMDSLVEGGCAVCLELGPGDALTRLMRDRHRDIAARSVGDFRSLDAVVDWVVGALA